MKKEWKDYKYVESLDNLEVMKARYYNHSFGRHYHDGYAFGLILDGCETYKYCRKDHVAPAGSVVVVNPGDVHTGHALDQQEGWSCFMTYPHQSLIKDFTKQLNHGDNRLPRFTETVIDNRELASRVYNLMKIIDSEDSRLGIESHFLETLNLLCKHHSERGGIEYINHRESEKVKYVVDRIRSDFAEELALESLASEVGLSSFALLRLFKKEKGYSPYLLQAGLRISKAKEYLLSSEAMADTAVLCGFTDQSHMTKQFRRWMGITPGEYLKQVKA